MRNSPRAQPAFGLPLIAAGLVASTIAMRPSHPARATQVRTVDARECAAFMDDSITAGSDRVESIVKFSEPAGDSLSASFPKESGIAVIWAKRQADDDPLSAHIALNTARAVSGQWKLKVVGTQNTCSGGVYVGKKKP